MKFSALKQLLRVHCDVSRLFGNTRKSRTRNHRVWKMGNEIENCFFKTASRRGLETIRLDLVTLGCLEHENMVSGKCEIKLKIVASKQPAGVTSDVPRSFANDRIPRTQTILSGT